MSMHISRCQNLQIYFEVVCMIKTIFYKCVKNWVWISESPRGTHFQHFYFMPHNGNSLFLILCIHMSQVLKTWPSSWTVPPSPPLPKLILPAAHTASTPRYHSLPLGSGISGSGTTFSWIVRCIVHTCVRCSYSMSSVYIIGPEW